MKTIEEKIAVMQAFADGREIEVKVEGGSEWVKASAPEWNWLLFDYRVKEEISIPKSWNEFCKKNDSVVDEYYITSGSLVRKKASQIYRCPYADSALLKTAEDAEGLLALIKLKRLRDAWWGNWRPDYKSDTNKYYICKEHLSCPDGTLKVCTSIRHEAFLIFPEEEMAQDFIECFKDLIKQAEMWL